MRGSTSTVPLRQQFVCISAGKIQLWSALNSISSRTLCVSLQSQELIGKMVHALNQMVNHCVLKSRVAAEALLH